MGRLEELKEERKKLNDEIKRLEEEASGIHCGSVRCQFKKMKKNEETKYCVSVFNPNRAGGKGRYYPFMFGYTKREISDGLQKLINDANELLNKLKEE